RPKATVKAPPTAAPTASMAPHSDDIMIEAVAKSSSGTRFGTAACPAGEKKAASAATLPCAAKASHTVPWWTSRKHNDAATCTVDTDTMSVRRLKRSAAGPASGVMRNDGSVWATNTRDA